MGWVSKGVVELASTGRSLKITMIDKQLHIHYFGYVSIGDLEKLLANKKESATIWINERKD